MKKIALITSCIFIIACGCTWKQLIGPDSGTSAEAQISLSKGIAKALSSLEYSLVKDRKVEVRVSTLAPEASGVSSVEGYVKAYLDEVLTANGAQVVHGTDEAGFLVLVMLRSSGVQTTERTLNFSNIPLFYSLTISGFGDAVVAGYDREKGEFFEMKSGLKLNEEQVVYLFRMFGPMYIEQ